MTGKITKRTVEALLPPASGRSLIMDRELPGFFVRVTANGVKTYGLKYSRRNRARWVTIGRHPDLTADAARKEAIRLRGEIARGGDPAAQHSVLRASPTVKELAKRYLTEHAEKKKSARSVKGDLALIQSYILPALGEVRVADVTTADLQRFHHSMSDTPIAANRALAVVSIMMSLAERWGLRAQGSNPARFVTKNPEVKRERIVTADELKRLGETLRLAAARGTTNPAVIACIRLLILTGCRLREILTLQWAFVDLKARRLHLPKSKTGAKTVPLGKAAVDLLAAIPRVGENPYVLPGLLPKSHYVGIGKAWDVLRKAAKLPDLRIHDLRHAYGQAGAAGGESLLVIGKLLGHASPTMTSRYASLSPDAAQGTADRIASAQARSLDGRKRGMVIPFDRLARRAKGDAA